ncbi:MAG TPA: hypothetical protein GXX19_06060 [Syntrophomonadaceae bacterium]|nr:hypothetical protein [Syntrophomonadaceae bacterium]
MQLSAKTYGGDIVTGKNDKGELRLRRIPERGEMFDLFRQVTEKIRREKASSIKPR